MSRPTIHVIILNWNGRAFLDECLSGLAAQSVAPERILLIDNGSTDDSVAHVRRHYPHVDIHENGGNLGFAAGNNVALRELTADVALLLNPDVVLSAGYLAALAGALADDPTIGVAGGKLWYPGGELIQHGGGYITHPQALPGHYGIGERDAGQYDTPRDVEYVIGAATAIRRELLAQIGPMDEGYFLYFEDVDLCARARWAGFRVVYLPAAAGVHVESATTHKGSPAYLRHFHSGRWRYLLKQFPAEEIVGDTLAAEAAWLERIDADERWAVTLAYAATRRQLLDIWTAREREGAGPVAPETQARVARGLAELQDKASRDRHEVTALAQLTAAAVLEERPFTSTVPLFGSLIARFRAAWNNVASRWYLAHLMTQQNEFNRLAVQRLAEYEVEAREQTELLEEQMVIAAELERRVQTLQARLAELEREAKQS